MDTFCKHLRLFFQLLIQIHKQLDDFSSVFSDLSLYVTADNVIMLGETLDFTEENIDNYNF